MANKARLIEVRDKILANKERFYYGKWTALLKDPEADMAESQKDIADRLEEDCETCGCVAGWAYTCIPSKDHDGPLIQDQAWKWLQLDIDDYYFLFVGHAGLGIPKIQYLPDATVWDAIQRLNLLIDRETERETADAE